LSVILGSNASLVPLAGSPIPRITRRPLTTANIYGSRFHPSPLAVTVGRRFNSSTSVGVLADLTHIDAEGRASMVNVGEKDATKRSATASGRIYIPAIAYELVTSTYFPSDTIGDNANNDAGPLDRAKAKSRRKGDTLTVAQLAAIMGCKRTSDLIPLCHPLALSHVSVTLIPELPNGRSKLHSIVCRATVSCEGKTGVEMEALTAVSVGLLTVWDMLKAVAGRDMELSEIMVTHKVGGRSGDFTRIPEK